MYTFGHNLQNKNRRQNKTSSCCNKFSYQSTPSLTTSMRVFLPAALRDQQQSSHQQQHQAVYSPSTSSVDTALVCNKSNKKKKAASNNNHHEAAVHDSNYRNLDGINEEEEADELLSLDFSLTEKEGGVDSNNNSKECGGSEEEAKKHPARPSSLLSSSSKLSPRASHLLFGSSA